MDVTITRRGPKRSTVVASVIGGLLVVALALAFPSIKRWSGTERSFDRSRLRFAQVELILGFDSLRDHEHVHVVSKLNDGVNDRGVSSFLAGIVDEASIDFEVVHR